MATCAFLVFTSLFGANGVDVPTYGEIGQAVLAGREKIKTLHVRTCANRPGQHLGVRSELYLDVDAGRWRRDTTGAAEAAVQSPDAAPAWNEVVCVNGPVIYDFSPVVPERVARVRRLASEVDGGRLPPFPDPRNAGLVPAYNGNSGTPYKSGGLRLKLYAYYVSCPDATESCVDATVWKGLSCWKARAIRIDDSHRRVFSYVVVPEWDNSVVLLTAETYRKNEGTPHFRFSVESEVALHEESKVWFPKAVHYECHVDGKRTQEEITEFEVVSLNRPMVEELFTFKGMGLPIGHAVMDLTDVSAAKKFWDGDRIVRVEGRSAPLVDKDESQDVNGAEIRQLITGGALLCVCVSAVLYFKGYLKTVRTRRE